MPAIPPGPPKGLAASPWIWLPLGAAVPLLAAGAVALAAHRLFLFASLGPTAALITQLPTQPSARPYNVFVGHALGFASGCALVFAFGIASAPSVFISHDVSWARIGAAVISVLLAAALEVLCNAQHAPSAATTLLVALGSFHPTWTDTGAVLGGVVIVMVVAELLRRVRLAIAAA